MVMGHEWERKVLMAVRPCACEGKQVSSTCGFAVSTDAGMDQRGCSGGVQRGLGGGCKPPNRPFCPVRRTPSRGSDKSSRPCNGLKKQKSLRPAEKPRAGSDQEKEEKKAPAVQRPKKHKPAASRKAQGRATAKKTKACGERKAHGHATAKKKQKPAQRQKLTAMQRPQASAATHSKTLPGESMSAAASL